MRQKVAGMVEALWIAAWCGGTDPATRTKTLCLDISPFCLILRLANSQEREYSLIEIIEKAKEGQVFESEYYQVKKINDRQISILDEVTQEWQIINFMVKFKLIKDPVDFNTAFEAYKNGKTITSIVSGETFDNYDSITRFETREIIGQWIIN